MLAFAMQVSERRVNHSLDNYGNCQWLVLLSMTGIGFGDFYPQTPLGRLLTTIAFGWGTAVAAMVIMTILRKMELSNSEIRVSNMIMSSAKRTQLKHKAAFYIQAAFETYFERLQRSQAATGALLGHEPLHADAKFCRTMRSFRELRKDLMTPDDILHLTFRELMETRSRLELRLRDVDEKLEEMDAKFEHNIAAMNELLHKNLKYLKHLAA